MNLVLIRHGKTEANEKHLYCGSTDIALSESGFSELEELKSKVSYPNIAGYRIITSGMIRCEQTLSLLYGDIPHEKMPFFGEMDFGEFEMRSYEQMKSEADYIAWISGDNNTNVAPGGESGLIMTSRVQTAIDGIVKDGRNTVVVTHGGPIAAIMSGIFTSENKNRYEWQPKPGLGYSLSIVNGIYSYDVIG